MTQWKKTGSVSRSAIRPDQRWMRFAVPNESGTTRRSFPHIRDAVSTWMIASATAPVASQAFAAIVDEKTVSTMSEYVELTSPRVTRRA